MSPTHAASSSPLKFMKIISFSWFQKDSLATETLSLFSNTKKKKTKKSPEPTHFLNALKKENLKRQMGENVSLQKKSRKRDFFAVRKSVSARFGNLEMGKKKKSSCRILNFGGDNFFKLNHFLIFDFWEFQKSAKKRKSENEREIQIEESYPEIKKRNPENLIVRQIRNRVGFYWENRKVDFGPAEPRLQHFFPGKKRLLKAFEVLSRILKLDVLQD